MSNRRVWILGITWTVLTLSLAVAEYRTGNRWLRPDVCSNSGPLILLFMAGMLVLIYLRLPPRN